MQVSWSTLETLERSALTIARVIPLFTKMGTVKICAFNWATDLIIDLKCPRSICKVTSTTSLLYIRPVVKHCGRNVLRTADK